MCQWGPIPENLVREHNKTWLQFFLLSTVIRFLFFEGFIKEQNIFI